jgi:hypothetical protein
MGLEAADRVPEADASTAGPVLCSPFVLHCGVWGLDFDATMAANFKEHA